MLKRPAWQEYDKIGISWYWRICSLSGCISEAGADVEDNMGMLVSLLSSVFRVNYAMYAQPVLHDCVPYLPIVRGGQASLTKVSCDDSAVRL